MKYFIDTEFHEGFHKPLLFGMNRHFIDLISIGIVDENGRGFYAISNEFDIKAAWNSYQIEGTDILDLPGVNRSYKKVYWLRENVLRSIFEELKFDEYMALTDKGVIEFTDIIREYPNRSEQLQFFKEEFLYRMPVEDWIFNYKNFKKIIEKYGKQNGQIAEEIKDFCKSGTFNYEIKPSPTTWHQNTLHTQVTRTDPEFYGYYCDYDWVVFCSLFGKMIDLPEGLPMYCKDLKQMLDEKIIHPSFESKNTVVINAPIDERLKYIKLSPNYPKQTDEHNALADAKWNRKLYDFINII